MQRKAFSKLCYLFQTPIGLMEDTVSTDRDFLKKTANLKWRKSQCFSLSKEQNQNSQVKEHSLQWTPSTSLVPCWSLTSDIKSTTPVSHQSVACTLHFYDGFLALCRLVDFREPASAQCVLAHQGEIQVRYHLSWYFRWLICQKQKYGNLFLGIK